MSTELLLQIYYGQFYSHLCYGCQMWGQDPNQIVKTYVLQKKAIRLITFSHYLEHSSPLFKQLNLLKLKDIITMSNIIFTHNTLNNKSPLIFNDYFKIKIINHRPMTLNTIYSMPKASLDVPLTNSTFGAKSIRNICATQWNDILRVLSIKNYSDYCKCEYWLQQSKLNSLKKMVKEYFLENY